MALAHVDQDAAVGETNPDCPTHMTTEVRRASFCRNERPRLQDPRTRRIFREEHRGCHSERDHARIKNHSRYEMVRSGANAGPHRGRIRESLPGDLAGWIYLGRVNPGEAAVA